MKSAIVLAAGKGTRMKSALNKVMHPVLNKPMIGHIVASLQKANVDRIVVVVGHGAKSVKEYLQDQVEYAVQVVQLGTGHAVMQATTLEGLQGDTMILCGDGPLIQPKTIQKVFQQHNGGACTVLTAVLPDGKGYGRILRGKQGNIDNIIEAQDCSQKEKMISEINTGIFCFNNNILFESLKELKNENMQHEYYLTDVVKIINKKGHQVNAMVVDDPQETMGVNDRVDLANATTWLKQHVNTMHMLQGVSIMDPQHTYIDVDVEIGEDSLIYPNVHIQGDTKIGKKVTILPNSFLRNAVIGDGVTIDSSTIVESKVGARTTIGPMSHVRAHTEICADCRIGNFVEFKNSQFGDGSKCAHLTYIGDSDFGKKINVGCGVVTVNYDGKNKFRTTVKDGAFIGSNCNLIAPITIGENVLLAAGSTITHSVEDGGMGIARARQSNIKGYGTTYKNK